MNKRPDYYRGPDSVYEAIKVIQVWGLGFELGNVIKYVARAGKKGNALDDLIKARTYLDFEIAKLEGEVELDDDIVYLRYKPDTTESIKERMEEIERSILGSSNSQDLTKKRAEEVCESLKMVKKLTDQAKAGIPGWCISDTANMPDIPKTARYEGRSIEFKKTNGHVP